MIYNVKLVKEVNVDTPVTDNYPCTHYSTREVTSDSLAAKEDLCPVGTTIELGPPTRRSFHVPSEEIDVIYIESGGYTIAKYPTNYVPVSKRQQDDKKEDEKKEVEFRVTEDSKEGK